MTSKIKMFAVAAVASAGLAGGSPAMAGNAVDSNVKLKFNFNEFEFRGQVSSDKGKCVRNRLVRVYRKEDGNDHLIGASKTDSGGKYDVGGFGSVEGGTPHYAVAVEKTTPEFTCIKAKSKNIEPNDFEN
jgi:hypothetical protein